MAQVTNELTIKMRKKGWQLSEFLIHIDRSISFYRMHAKKGGHKYDWLCYAVDNLENRNA